MFISPALAQDAATATGALGGLQAFLPLILIFVIFYFLLIRPQQKRMKEHKAMLAAIRRGDRIVTNGGLIGSVVKVVNDQELSVEVADGVRVRVMRDMVASVMSKTEPVSGGKAGGDGASDGSEAPANDTAKGDSGAAKLKGLLGGGKSSS